LNQLPLSIANTLKESAIRFLPSFVEIQQIANNTHPAFGQFGVFSKIQLERGYVLGEYTGVVKLTNLKKTSGYASILYEDGTHSIDVDAVEAGNEFRFLNDYRGVSATPNVKLFATVFNGEYHIAVTIIKRVNKGEELLVDYGSTYWVEKE